MVSGSNWRTVVGLSWTSVLHMSSATTTIANYPRTIRDLLALALAIPANELLYFCCNAWEIAIAKEQHHCCTRILRRIMTCFLNVRSTEFEGYVLQLTPAPMPIQKHWQIGCVSNVQVWMADAQKL